ncbi:MAG TPA: response regulator, partial [Gammaproteobacteria bacterium]|nr:response regulator [Gammaproteobacteria bacterium]
MATHTALVVDDEPDIRELLELTLGRMNIETRAAADLKEARGLLASQHFDLCLTDMRLPDGNGLTLVEEIQQQFPDLPVAVI